MTVLGDAWKSIRTIATILDKTETNTRDIRDLSASLTNARERLAGVEALLQAAVSRQLRLPKER